MTRPPDTERLIRAYLDEGLNELPDRVYEVVRSDIDRTRQRVVIGPWRTPDMNTFAKLAMAAAAVVVVAIVGYNLLPGSRRGGRRARLAITVGLRVAVAVGFGIHRWGPQRRDPAGPLQPGTYTVLRPQRHRHQRALHRTRRMEMGGRVDPDTDITRSARWCRNGLLDRRHAGLRRPVPMAVVRTGSTDWADRA